MRQISKVSLTTTLAAVLFVLVLGFGLSVPSFADDSNVYEILVSKPGVKAVGNPVVENLDFMTAHDVFQIRTTTPGAFLQVDLQDCCISGDQWTQRTYCLQNGRIWDSRSKATGGTTGYTALTISYKQGAQPMDCVTEVRYGEGVAIFPAGMSVRFRTSAGSNVTSTVLSTLAPLPSQ